MWGIKLMALRHHADPTSDKLSARRAKLRTYFQKIKQTLPPFEVKSANLKTSPKWIPISIKADLSHFEQTTNKNQKQLTTILLTNILITSGKSIPLTSTYLEPSRSQFRKHLHMCFHQTFSLDPTWFFVHSRIGSGHVIIWKMTADKYKPPSTAK